jgi:hypothetical protein
MNNSTIIEVVQNNVRDSIRKAGRDSITYSVWTQVWTDVRTLVRKSMGYSAFNPIYFAVEDATTDYFKNE